MRDFSFLSKITQDRSI